MPRITLLLAALAAGLGGCAVLGLDDDPGEELREAFFRWQRRRPTEYSYTLRRLCYCLPQAVGPVRIRVRGDSVQSRTYTASGEPVPAQFAELFGPMEAVFEVVARAIDGGTHSLDARYDSRRGFPVTVAIDYHHPTVDDELTLRVSEFETP